MAVADRDIHLRVIVDEDSKDADKAAAALDRVGKAADRAGDHSKTMARDMALPSQPAHAPPRAPPRARDVSWLRHGQGLAVD